MNRKKITGIVLYVFMLLSVVFKGIGTTVFADNSSVSSGILPTQASMLDFYCYQVRF